MKDCAIIYNMENLKIYINGKYDIKANAIHQLKVRTPKILQKIDDGFNRLYEI